MNDAPSAEDEYLAAQEPDLVDSIICPELQRWAEVLMSKRRSESVRKLADRLDLDYAELMAARKSLQVYLAHLKPT